MTYDGVINKPPLDEALQHYGVPGMRWGVRHDRDKKTGRLNDKTRKKLRKGIDVTSSRGKIRRRLNNLENSKVDFLGKVAGEKIAQNKYKSKLEKSKAKGKTKKVDKYTEKLAKSKKIQKLNEQYIKDLDSAIKDVYKIGSKNYDISKKQIYKQTSKGRASSFSSAYALGILGALGMAGAQAAEAKKYEELTGGNTSSNVKSDVYKVKKKKK